EGRIADERCLHVAVAVPERLAVPEPHAVHHAVTEERMRARAGEWIRAVADVPAVELGRNRSFYLELRDRPLFGHRSAVAAQVQRRPVILAHRSSLPCPSAMAISLICLPR